MAIKEFTGRCYCGAFSFKIQQDPQVVAYCHCSDCKRWTGSPLPCFAAFEPSRSEFTPALNSPDYSSQTAQRWNCQKCGSPLAATFDYLPDQLYIPVGLIDQANDLKPDIHCHGNDALHWLDRNDGLPREPGTGRESLLSGDLGDG